MAEDKQRTLARQGGRAVQASGLAHTFTAEEARRGGEAVSRNRQHMAEIGRKGGRSSAARLGPQGGGTAQSPEQMAQEERAAGGQFRGETTEP